jgi:hypothetical protein
MAPRLVNDQDKVLAGIRRAEAEGREIDHGTARTIAAMYHDGSTLSLVFVSTGAIDCEDSSELYNVLTDNSKLYREGTSQERRMLDWLGTYLVRRSVGGDKGEVRNWSDKWATN